MEQDMVNELVNGILRSLHVQPLRIVLYGSTARGTNTAESDIDIAVFVRSRLQSDEDDRLSDAIVDMNLKYGKVFSVIDIDESTYQKWRAVLPFYQNVDREGVVLWTAA